ncbi:NlpC/P60 family protein, partial [bacterium]
GGLVQNSGPIVLSEPKVAPAAGNVDESQRILLARLDADLAQAQQRLDRAETRLTEGQRQLGSFTNVLQSAILEAGDDARGLHPFVRVAQRYLGTPYVWGGESARGFDCSGFIMRVMRDLGYKALPHSAAEQFNYGTPIAKGLLKPGDVVFFANTYKPGISHVGIYLGKGRFIHAANSHVGTIVSHLNEPKWVEKYAGARRLIRVKS